MRGFVAILKKELFLSFHTPMAWCLIGAYALISAFHLVLHLTLRTVILPLEIQFMGGLMFLLMPLLTMGMFSDEEKWGTDILLLGAPIRMGAIVLGKYIARCILFAFMLIILLLHVLVTLALGGTIDHMTFYTLLTYAMIGLLYLAIATFIAFLFRQTLVGTLMSVLLFVGLSLLSGAAVVVARFVVQAITALDLFGWISASLQQRWSENLGDWLGALSPITLLNQVTDGRFNGLALLMACLLGVVCLHAATLVLKARYGRRVKCWRLRIVGQLLAMILVFVLSTVWLGNYFYIDITPNKVMSLSAVSKEILGALKTPLSITVLDSKANFQLHNDFAVPLLDEYVKAGKGKIDLEYVDLGLSPERLSKLDPEGLKGLSNGQIYIENPASGRYRILQQSDLIQSQIDEQSGQAIQIGYTAERSMTSAIQFLQREDAPVFYVTTGHGETAIDREYKTLRQVLNQFGIEVETLDLKTQKPERAVGILALAPRTDFAPLEREKILSYLEDGGSFWVIADPGSSNFTELNQLLELFYLNLDVRTIREENTQLTYQGNPVEFLAQVPKTRITDRAYPNSVLVRQARVVTALPNPPEWIGVDQVLTTDGNGRLMNVDGTTAQSNLTGVYSVAQVSENSQVVKSANGSTAKVMVMGSSSVIDDDTLALLGTSGYNYSFLVQSIRWLTNRTDASNQLLIPTQRVLDYRLSRATSTGILWARFIVLVVLPLLCFVVGWVIWRKRQRDSLPRKK